MTESRDSMNPSQIRFSDGDDGESSSPTLDYGSMEQPSQLRYRQAISSENLPSLNDIGITINPEQDHLNRDLLNYNFEWNMSPQSPISRVPLMEPRSFEDLDNFEPLHNPTSLGIQSRMTNPYFLLEAVACGIFDLILCSNAFTFTLLINGNIDINVPLRFLVFRAINLTCLGLVCAIFTTPDTYKSINISIEYLAINAIIYEYSLKVVLQYLLIRIVSGITFAFLTTWIFYDLITQFTTEDVISNVLFVTTNNYKFSYSFYLTALLLHLSIAIGLSLVVDNTTSTNAKISAIIKSGVIYMCRLSFGVIVGPIGYIWSNIALYFAIVVNRHRYDLLDFHIIATYLVMIVGIVIIYPLIAIQVKFIWKNKYRRYIEYIR